MTRSGPRPRFAVILAAGRGTRMRSPLPKVLHPAAGRPLVRWVMDAAREAGCQEIFVVVPPDSETGATDIRRALESVGEDAGPSGRAAPRFVVQTERRGTGHALLQTAGAVSQALRETGRDEATLLVLSGDAPLITADTLDRLATLGESAWGALAVAQLDEPGSLGRVLTRDDGSLDRIVEASDATPEVLEVRTINAGFYALPAPAIFRDLEALGSDNAQGEIYLTDAPGAAAARGERVQLLELDDPLEGFGVNTRSELEQADRALFRRRLAPRGCEQAG